MTWTFQQIMPPGARGSFDRSLYADQDWYAEEKLDGDRRIAQFCDRGELPMIDGAFVRFTGRRISDVDGLLVEKTACLPHLNGNGHYNGAVHVAGVPAPKSLIGTVLDGEMIVDKAGARSRDVTSIIGSKPEGAIQKQVERGWLVYVVFDCLFYKGEDLRKMSLVRRRRYLQQVIDEWKNPFVRMVPNTALAGVAPEDFLLGIWGRGGEGVILKDLNSTYGDEKAWVKVKREFTEDVVIIGYDAPEEQTAKKRQVVVTENGFEVKKRETVEVSQSRLAANGWIGALRFGQFVPVPADYVQDEKKGDVMLPQALIDGPKGKMVLRYCGSCSGMDDTLRKEFSDNKEKYIGQVVEILANEREPSGKFRHPRMVRLRNDKNPSDCVWGQK
jgi:ATP-dependent DNA ligase